MGGLASGIGGILKSAGQAVGLVPQGEFKIGTKGLTSGFATPGFNLAIGGKRAPTTLTSLGGLSAAEQAIQDQLGANLAGVSGLRSGLAPLRGSAASLQGLFPGLRASSAALGGQVQGLLGEVRPGFGRLTASLVEGVRNREAASVGNLRSALAKRNVLGSSFAQRELERTGLDFAQEEERVRTAAFQQELAASQGLIQQAGELIKLDAGLIQEEATNIGLQMGLSAFEAEIFGQEMNNIQQQQNLLAQSLKARLDELAITGNIANNIQALVTDIFQQNAAFAAGSSLQQQANLASTVFGGLRLGGVI